jgi:hypothetical protein
MNELYGSAQQLQIEHFDREVQRHAAELYTQISYHCLYITIQLPNS